MDGDDVDAELLRSGASTRRPARAPHHRAARREQPLGVREPAVLERRVDCCHQTPWTVANGLWLGADITGIVDWFVEHRQSDGG